MQDASNGISPPLYILPFHSETFTPHDCKLVHLAIIYMKNRKIIKKFEKPHGSQTLHAPCAENQ
jgi:hypothetical protein